MRNAARWALAGATAGWVLLTAGQAWAAAPSDYPAPSRQEHTYSIPVGAITDLGDLTKVADLGDDVAALLTDRQ